MKKRIAVVGGGWSGLYALKYFLEEGHEAILFEKSNSIGGVWVYREDQPGGVFKSTITTSSKVYLHASDFPIPKSNPNFLPHSAVLEYLKNYANHFKLMPHIKLYRQVERVQKEGDQWKVVVCNLEPSAGSDDQKEKGKEKDKENEKESEEDKDKENEEESMAMAMMEETYMFDVVAICSGQHQLPYSPQDEEPFCYFSGEMFHSTDYKHPHFNLGKKHDQEPEIKLEIDQDKETNNKNKNKKKREVAPTSSSGSSSSTSFSSSSSTWTSTPTSSPSSNYATVYGSTKLSKKPVHGVDLRNKTVLIVGGGESATDIAVDIQEVAKKVVVSMRKGVWFHDRTFGATEPSDMIWTKHQRDWNFSNFEGWWFWSVRWIMLELMWGKGGSGIKVWQPSCRYFQGPINHSRDIIDRIALTKIEAVGEVVKIEGKNVWMRTRKLQGNAVHKKAKVHSVVSGGGQKIEVKESEVSTDECKMEKIDVIIFATGFKDNLGFLNLHDKDDDDDDKGDYHVSKNSRNSKFYSAADAFKLVFYAHDPSLCFIGSARPFLGSIPGLAELQARWAAKVYAGKASLPSTKEMLAAIEKDRKAHAKLYTADHERLPQLVNHWVYADDISKRFGAKPSQWTWLRRSPLKWWSVVSCPWNAFLYRLNDPTTRSVALARIEETMAPYHFPRTILNGSVLFLDFLVLLAIFLVFVASIILFIYLLKKNSY
jgi:cation diffusion facilitator CzcD-associated flavoprotein CzcO